MLLIKNKLNSIDKRLKHLKDNNNKIIIEFITDLKNSKLYYILKVVNNSQIIYSQEIEDTPNKHISDLIDKYNCSIDYEFYNIVDNKKIQTI